MRDSRLDKLAEVLVRYSVGVKKGDLVRLSGPVVALPLVRALYRRALEAGGHPYLKLVDDACTDSFYEVATDEQLGFQNPLAMTEIETIDCSIGIWADENTKALTRVDPARQSRVSQARKPIMEVFMKRAALEGDEKLRWSGTQYPCQASAQDAEMSLAQYEDFVFRAGLLHLDDPVSAWEAIAERQQRVCDHLAQAKEIHFQTPNGTDLRCSIEGRHWINCAGHENFPDGEVFTAPIEDSTEGVVCYSFPAVHHGQEVHDIRLTFRNGRVVDASASKGEDFLIQMLDQDDGARTLGELAIGTNYAITEYTKNTLFDEKIGGTFHAALGAAYPESGGTNSSGLHWDMVCDLRRGGTVTVDGVVISRDGVFLQDDWPRPESST